MACLRPLWYAALLSFGLTFGSSLPGRAIAITIDDLPVVGAADIEQAERVTRDLLAALRRSSTPAIGFVNEGKLHVDGRPDPRRVALLQQWLDAGFDLGNHTWSHIDLHAAPLEDVQRDVLAGEKITRPLAQKAGRTLRYFRHPYLRTGRSLDVRERFERFLTGHGYAVAPVTYDNYDYIFAAAYDRAARDTGARAKIAASYLDYMEAIAAYYEQQSMTIVGREFPQVLLLHANALNADTFVQLAARFRARGYRFIALEEALADPVYRLPDTFVGPGGITWIHRWALTKGLRGIFAGEPRVPDWIAAAARGGSQ
jgi:peptidoglycan/xylan/chitin deacetylase (PgdA/CDA1 family)